MWREVESHAYGLEQQSPTFLGPWTGWKRRGTPELVCMCKGQHSTCAGVHALTGANELCGGSACGGGGRSVSAARSGSGHRSGIGDL